MTKSEVSKGTRATAPTGFIPGSASKLHSPSDVLGLFLLEKKDAEVRSRDEGSRQSTGGPLTSASSSKAEGANK